MNSAPSDISPEPATPRCPACDRALGTGASFCVGCGRAVGPVVVSGLAVGPDTDQDADRDTDRGAGQGTVQTIGTNGGQDEGTVCQVCGSANAVTRILCGACGADLERMDHELTVSPFLEPIGTAPSTRVADELPRSRWWVPVAAILLVVGGVTAALAWLELGPFATEQELPTAAFRDDVYPYEPERIALSDVATVTSAAPVDGRTFTPANLVDGDPETAWHGDAASLPPGTNEKIDLFLEQPAWVVAVIVDNGDHLDADEYAASARAQGATLVFDGDVRVPVTLLDQGRSPQIIPLDAPVLTASVRLEIATVFPGTERTDVALTRIELLGHEAMPEDAEVARERADAMSAAGVIVLPE